MRPEDELALKVTKEIVIKFIEVGKVSVTSFDEAFRQIHGTVRKSLRETPPGGKTQGKS
ncbi:MAG: hypothetical protein JXL84_22955 [Deltaproteobacteria bacterium]|nr:hypothetical protein [Deltaproteobacteria bacterium]